MTMRSKTAAAMAAGAHHVKATGTIGRAKLQRCHAPTPNATAAWLWWALSAKNWFTGPKHTVAGPVVTDADTVGAEVPGQRGGDEAATAAAAE